MAVARVSKRRIEAAICTLADLTYTEDYETIDGATRDEIGQLIHIMEQIVEAR